MFLISTLLAVIIADIHGKSSTLQENNATFIGQHDECTTSTPERHKSTTTILICVPHMEQTFSSINEKWIQKPVWDHGIALEALKEAVTRYSTQADFKIYRRKIFSKGVSNMTTVIEKVMKVMDPVLPFWLDRDFSILHWIQGQFQIPRPIPENSYYGCNGVFNTTGVDDVLTVVCLYRTEREKRWWQWYRNIEI